MFTSMLASMFKRSDSNSRVQLVSDISINPSSIDIANRAIPTDDDYNDVINEITSKKPSSDNNNEMENTISLQDANPKPKPQIRQLSESSIANYTCPISFEIMVDPVVTKEGYSFERNAILKWLETHTTCPLSRFPLNASDLVPNKSLKQNIENYRELGLLPKLVITPQTTLSLFVKEKPTTNRRRSPGLWTPTNNSSTSAYVTRREVAISWSNDDNEDNDDNNDNEVRRLLQEARLSREQPELLRLQNINEQLRLQNERIEELRRMIIPSTFNTEELPLVDIPENPDFSFLDNHRKHMIQSAYLTINTLNKWDYVRRYNPSNSTGYLFDDDVVIAEIMSEIENHYGGHSGTSIAYTMRTMQFIAENGFENFKQEMLLV